MLIQFTVTYLDGREQVHRLDKDQFTLGRSTKCDVVLLEEGFSRQHCLIEVIDGDVFATDMGSANGVLINEEKIPPHQRTKYNLSFNLNLAGVEISGFQFLNDPNDGDEQDESNEVPGLISRPPPPYSSRKKSTISNGATANKRSAVNKMHPGLRGMVTILVLIVVVAIYQYFLSDSENEDEVISQMLYESNTSKKKADGSFKTRNF